MWKIYKMEFNLKFTNLKFKIFDTCKLFLKSHYKKIWIHGFLHLRGFRLGGLNILNLILLYPRTFPKLIIKIMHILPLRIFFRNFIFLWSLFPLNFFLHQILLLLPPFDFLRIDQSDIRNIWSEIIMLLFFRRQGSLGPLKFLGWPGIILAFFSRLQDDLRWPVFGGPFWMGFLILRFFEFLF